MQTFSDWKQFSEVWNLDRLLKKGWNKGTIQSDHKCNPLQKDVADVGLGEQLVKRPSRTAVQLCRVKYY